MRPPASASRCIRARSASTRKPAFSSSACRKMTHSSRVQGGDDGEAGVAPFRRPLRVCRNGATMTLPQDEPPGAPLEFDETKARESEEKFEQENRIRPMGTARGCDAGYSTETGGVGKRG